MDLRKGIQVNKESENINKELSEKNQKEINDEINGVTPRNEFIFSNDLVEPHSNNLNDLINKTFKQKYDKFCIYEKKIKASEALMSEITKKTNVVDLEFKRSIFTQKAVNYDEEYKKLINLVEGSIGPKNNKDKMPKIVEIKKLKNKIIADRNLNRKDLSSKKDLNTNEAKNNHVLRTLDGTRQKKPIGLKRLYRNKMEEILTKMPKFE